MADLYRTGKQYAEQAKDKKYEKLKQKIEQIQTVIDQLPPPTCKL